MNIRQSPPPRHRLERLPTLRGARGLTLVELLMGLLLMSVVLTIAVPSFEGFTKRTRVDLQITDVRSAMDYARSESLRRGLRVVVCSVQNVNAKRLVCNTGSNAWGPRRNLIVFIDNVHLAGNNVAVVDGPDTVLRAWEPPEDAKVNTTYMFGSWVAFTPQGRVVANTGTGSVWGGIGICQAPYARTLELNQIGRLAESVTTC